MTEYPKYKRQMPEETKQKISQTMTGVKKSPEHCQHISQSVKAAWNRVPKVEG